ncbi:MetQ/NlpA family ABC transporter substrate-binding protein [Sporolactobacillus terrae]|uniref:MetQ/NlpA family ABC transporter substrate-binding protein n=1 Tax=Sporolactobacillus terrae TaxID=269673 RepID=UPI00048ED093|nr:MetQ/NlpA family ABC transporter substrate-binding protein [Sporolactobacillus terrae]
MKKHIGILLSIILAFTVILSGCRSAANGNDKTLTIGSVGSDAQIWQHIAKSSATKKAGLTIRVKTFTDGVQLNNATAEGKIDVNAFQSWTYFKSYVNESKAKVSAFATTYLEPMGIYSDRLKDLKQVSKRATVALPKDPANEARALQLLQTAGLIKLKPGFNAFGTVNDIAVNPLKLQFKEIDGSTGPRVLKDVDLVLIGNTVALESHLNVLKDSLFHEELNQDTKANVNILVTKTSNLKNKQLKRLAALYHSQDTKNYIEKQFNGTKVDIDKPISYLK